ncbi:aminotransferase class V-fold PLP-dependent enzyme [Laedolimicola ammoniilytica]|uniref:cysteine desulfurase n=1 Tax=Laedolimicola ammoniilytica TaxID=2981771 RepID=A0ABT2RXV8_9FIRM|nr:aminotransferase class V-fold PLP-dependent enzyme [Laedolimicola ammoniilytica]MCU6696850.1 aminotransferase class V-fold PLP-dependent enzyme [Laedolimicola ammoniilytica]SCH96061.1 Cysteine sulfinate desulfinase [uncultured Clostridium sp.]
MIYLDNGATTLRKPECVKEALLEAMASMGNSGRGVHDASLYAGRTIYRARESLAELLGAAAPEQVAFTANATESLNLVLGGLFGPGDHVITTVCEHNSVLRPLYRLQGVELSVLPVKAAVDSKDGRYIGILAYDELESLLRPNTKALIITHASNLTGNITDLERAAAFTKKHSLLLIVDAAQTAGTVPMDMERMGIDVLCFTGHKGLYGPQGTGGLCVRPGLSIRPLKVGGSGIHSFDREHPSEMPAALEAGTLNGHGIAGLGAAARWLLETGVEQIRAREQALLRRFVDGVKEVEGVTLYGNPDLDRRTGIQSLNIRDYDSARVADWLYEDYGIAVRGGAHCAPLMHEALGTREQGAVRFSFSYFNTEAEADEAAAAVRELAEE